MQENIENFVNHFGIEHCFEFTITAPRLSPADFKKCLNSALTNFLRERFPDRIGVTEPTKAGHAHEHNLVAVPFTSPNFDHLALKLSREAFNRKDFSESKRQWAKCKASMSPEHSALWQELRDRLPKFGLGGQIGFAPVRESARAIACYFGKYLAKGIAERPDDWKGVRLVNYSRNEPATSWKCSNAIRSSNGKLAQNHRDRMEALAPFLGTTSEEGLSPLLGRHWWHFYKDIFGRVELPSYRSLFHAEADGYPHIPLPEGVKFEKVLIGDDASTVIHFPPEADQPWTPPAVRPGYLAPFDAAVFILSQAGRYHRTARDQFAKLSASPALALSRASARKGITTPSPTEENGSKGETE